MTRIRFTQSTFAEIGGLSQSISSGTIADVEDPHRFVGVAGVLNEPAGAVERVLFNPFEPAKCAQDYKRP